ncbi:Caspase recruitment domain [Mactra antiquata]
MDIIEKRARECRPMIVSLVKESSLVTNLMSLYVITEEEACKVRTMMQNDTFKANEIMMDCVFRSEQPGKWTSFMEALKKSGYDGIRRALMSSNDDNDVIKAHILNNIQIHTAELANMKACCMPLAVRLYSESVLTDVDFENISSEYQRKGDYDANVMLLDRMKSRLTPRIWYCEFLQALMDIECDHLVEMIEPKFIHNKDHLLETFGVEIESSNVTGRGQTSEAAGNQTSVSYVDMSIREHVLTVAEEGEMEVDNMAPPPVPPRSYSLGDTEQYISNNIDDGDNTDVKELYNRKKMLNNKEFPEDSNISVGNDNVGYENHAIQDDDDNDSLESDDENDKINTDQSMSTYQLRSYQTELAENAINGKNTIICSETGTGKTWVALEIIKRHLEMARKGSKVAFMARTGLLVKQQADRLVKHLPMYKTKLITGEDEDSKQLNMYMDMNDILCFTPQILVNNLDVSTVKSLSEYSLLILDECHHTKGDEPYNRLMRKYLVEKAEGVKNLPQIVGLTASIGVGKSRTEDEAVDYIIRVMACLDVRILSTVDKNIAALSKHINMPEEETIALLKPNPDPCKTVLLTAIEATEDLLDDNALMQPDIVDMITENKPSEKESQSYNKWTVDMFKAAQLKLDDYGVSRDICACARYLNTFNSALEINKLLRAKDIIKFLAQKHQPDGIHRDKHTEVEKTLYQKLLDVQKELTKKGKDIENPNVRTLSNTLRKMLESKGDDSRALVFVKARATCRALAEFLDKDLGQQGYRTSPLYGKENRGGDDGMTESVQTDILEKFREGFYKVIVCTSVGNEGIDVPQCNIVLSYEYSGDEITKIQMKGRARQKDAVVTLMADEKLLEQDRINAYKAAMMNRALKRVKLLQPRYIETKVKGFQTDEMSKYRFKVATEDYKKARKSEEDHDILCGRCTIFGCFVSDVRQMNSNYVVIDKEFPDKVTRREHRRPKTYDGLHKKFKMYCKKCGLDWGIIGICKGLECHILKIENMVFRNHRTREKNVYRKWDDQPYRVPKITPDDIPNMLGNQL